MNITIIGTAYPYRGGGIATFNERLAQGLMDMGHRVIIETFTLQYPNFLFPGKTQLSEEAAPPHLQINRSVNSVSPINWLSVGHKLRKRKDDLVIIRYWLPFMGPCFGTILRQIRKNKHTKVLCIIDNAIPHEPRVGDKIFTKYFVSQVDSFVAMSREVLKDLKTFNDYTPALYLPHPVYDNYGAPVPKQEALKHIGLDSGTSYLLFFGFIRKYKGLDLLLEAMSDPRIKAQKIKLIVAGEYYGDESYYEEIINRLGIREQLELFTDFIPNDEVKYYFSAADVVVQPYKTATQSGISQVAYHFERPMIVTDVGGLPEIVPHGKVGYVVKPQPQEIADAIIKFYEENNQHSFEQNIIKEKQKYSWEHFIQAALDTLSPK